MKKVTIILTLALTGMTFLTAVRSLFPGHEMASASKGLVSYQINEVEIPPTKGID